MATKDVSQQPSKARKQKRLVEMRKSKNVRNTEVDKQLWPSRSAAHTSLHKHRSFQATACCQSSQLILGREPCEPEKPVLVISKIHLFISFPGARDGLSLCLFCMSSFLTFRVRDLQISREPHLAHFGTKFVEWFKFWTPRACLRKPEAHHSHFWPEQSRWPSGPRT